MTWWVVSNEVERMLMEEAMAYFNAPPWNLRAESKEHRGHLIQDRFIDQPLDLGPLKHKKWHSLNQNIC